MGRSWQHRAMWAVVITTLVAAGAIGLATPSSLEGSFAWAFVVAAVLYGHGAILRRVLGITVGIAEQLALGTISWIFLTGVLLSAGIASSVPLFVLAGIGFVAASIDLVQSPPETGLGKLATEERWVIGILLTALGGFLVVNLLATVGSRGNPWDDHIAYTAFVKRVLDCGDLNEPFSFRRLSAYGGQTMLLALQALRGEVQSTDVLDRGVFQIIALLFVIEIGRRRRVHFLITTVVILFLLCLWETSINSASTWTGFVVFIAAYNFACRDDLTPRTSLVLTFAACGAACTLRQNYILPAGVFAVLLLWRHIRVCASESSWRDAWRAERQTITLAIGVAALLVVPYALATWTSSRTFLYPIMPGTWNPAAPLRPAAADAFDEMMFFVTVILRSAPIRVWWLLIPIMAIARDRRALRPWHAFLIANLIGFAFLIHSFLLSDSATLWRYAFGYMTPMLVVFLLEIADVGPLEEETSSPLRLPRLAALLVVLALIVQFSAARDIPMLRAQWSIENMRAARVFEAVKIDSRVLGYGDMQRTIPGGAKIAIWLDDPYVLDYARNPIVNLDLPGFAAPGKGLPSFTTPEHWRSFFASQGIRYVAFVASDYSSYMFRRPSWMWRMFADDELWRFMAAHMVDTYDVLHELVKTSRVLYHQEGLYALDLGEQTGLEADRGAPELERMDNFVRTVSERELGSNAWQLISRRNFVFSPDGPGPSAVVPMAIQTPNDGLARGVIGLFIGGAQVEAPHRWLMDRTHFRVRGERHQRLHLRLWINRKRLFTTPTLTLTLDGKVLGRTRPNADGNVTFDVTTECRGWCELYLVSSTISEYWRSASDLQAIKLLESDWVEVP